jgi:hypothetical protein
MCFERTAPAGLITERNSYLPNLVEGYEKHTVYYAPRKKSVYVCRGLSRPHLLSIDRREKTIGFVHNRHQSLPRTNYDWTASFPQPEHRHHVSKRERSWSRRKPLGIERNAVNRAKKTKTGLYLLYLSIFFALAVAYIEE